MREHPYECVEIKNNKWNYLAEPKKKFQYHKTINSISFLLMDQFILTL